MCNIFYTLKKTLLICFKKIRYDQKKLVFNNTNLRSTCFVEVDAHCNTRKYLNNYIELLN